MDGPGPSPAGNPHGQSAAERVRHGRLIGPGGGAMPPPPGMAAKTATKNR